jgi:CubicO group peptidase (beta-lactamase class C family)
MDQSYAELTDPVARWVPSYFEPFTTVGELLSHTAPIGGFRYSPERFAALTSVVEECGDRNFGQMLAEEVFEIAGMIDSVPGEALTAPSPQDAVVRRLAVPYRVISRRAQRNADYRAQALDASTGIVSTVSDLARFDVALDGDVLLPAALRNEAWSPAHWGTLQLPTGLGWFVQTYNGQPVVWQFGLVDGAFSSLMIKVPYRHLTFIALANSDGLSAPFALDAGDVTSSLFARLFLKSFVP